MPSENPQMSKKEKSQIYLLGLEEIRERFRANLEASDVLDQKASTYLTSIGIVLALFGFSIPTNNHRNYTVIVAVIFSIIFILLCIQVILTIKILQAKPFKTPFIETWEGISSAILCKGSGYEAQEQMICNYLDRINANRNITYQKGKLLNHISVIFGVELILAVGLRFIITFA